MKQKGFRLQVRPDSACRKSSHMGSPFLGKMMKSPLLMIFQHSYRSVCRKHGFAEVKKTALKRSSRL